jgi:hypothetical protein
MGAIGATLPSFNRLEPLAFSQVVTTTLRTKPSIRGRLFQQGLQIDGWMYGRRCDVSIIGIIPPGFRFLVAPPSHLLLPGCNPIPAAGSRNRTKRAIRRSGC